MGIVGWYDPCKHGASVSQLQDWLCCRELARYRLLGVKTRWPSLALTFGTIVHETLALAHIAFAKAKGQPKLPGRARIRKWLEKIEADWRKDNPGATERSLDQLELSLLFSEAVLPIYFEYWRKDLERKTWIEVEEEFMTPFNLYTDDAMTVPLKGKRDAVFKEKNGLWLLETKTKSRINEETLMDTLPEDVQMCGYLSALRKEYKAQPKGVLYNVIRRPLLKQKKNETLKEYADRCAADVEARPEFYFLRFEVAVNRSMLGEMEHKFTVLLQEYYRWWNGESAHYRNPMYCENKYGACSHVPLCHRGETYPFTNTGALE